MGLAYIAYIIKSIEFRGETAVYAKELLVHYRRKGE